MDACMHVEMDGWWMWMGGCMHAWMTLPQAIVLPPSVAVLFVLAFTSQPLNLDLDLNQLIN
jgi:hypothetical protein